MMVERINTYTDPRFAQRVLDQHGAFLVDGMPCEVEIVGKDSAVIRGCPMEAIPELIDAFRFHAPEISRFMDQEGRMIVHERDEPRFAVSLRDLQPSQFYVDQDKLKAVRTFVHSPEDVVIQVMPYQERYVVLDGHTRLYAAVQSAFTHVLAVSAQADETIWMFVQEAEKRGIHTPKDLQVVQHEEYDRLWNRYCDELFACVENQQKNETIRD